MRNKKLIIILVVVGLIIILPIAWYLISPIWRVRVINDTSPLVDTSIFDTMPSVPTGSNPTTTTQIPTGPITNAPPTTTTKPEIEKPTVKPVEKKPQIVAQGNFAPRAHEVEGRAVLIEHEGKQVVRFENFKTIDGPDVRVYLASDYDIGDAVELDELKATSGNVNYPVPAGADTKKYNKVLIWCRPFRVLFSAAELK